MSPIEQVDELIAREVDDMDGRVENQIRLLQDIHTDPPSFSSNIPIQFEALMVDDELRWDDFADLFPPLPPDMVEREKQVMPVPDCIEEAQIECARAFLNECLWPKLSLGLYIGLTDLIELVTNFKTEFRQRYPTELDCEFSLIQEVERLLFLWELQHVDVPSEDTERIQFLSHYLGTMLSEYAEILYAY